MSENAYYLVKDGPVLDLLLAHMAERDRVRLEAQTLIKELGTDEGRCSGFDGRLTSIVWPPGKVPEGWTKPHRKTGASRPKVGTEMGKRFAALKGWRSPADVLSQLLSLPLSLSYKGPTGTGWSAIGSMCNECGFLWMSREGPYAIWVPDVPAAVAKREAEGYTVDEPAKSFKMEFPGCTRILHEEWKVMVLQREISEKQSKALT